jgi:4a-hydroxytetrahydrobiopterin dehydratase
MAKGELRFNGKGGGPMGKLSTKRCVACDGNTPKLTQQQLGLLLPEVPGWNVSGKTLERQYSFPDFKTAISFINQMAEVAEAEQHHPDFLLHSYRLLDVKLSTHAIDGLSENDFILAAKLNELHA